jgi:hypothetical protein
VRRLEQTLNKPIVVLVVGVVAVALNVLLYFGYFLPRMTPLVEQINSIGTSLPEAITKLGTEADSKSDSKTGSNSDSETGSKSDPGSSSGKANLEASGTSASEGSRESGSDSPSDSPSGSPAVSLPKQQSSASHQSHGGSSPPELPPLPTPSQGQYQ